LYRRCPPIVLIDGSFPDLAQRVTVFGLTLNIAATSLGVMSVSVSFMGAVFFPPSL
jgi:hypothetical protein